MATNQTPFRKGFESQLTETPSTELILTQGSIPSWLEGTYVRNGPGQFELPQGRYWHWFDGLAMPHRYQFGGGKVTFANKYLKTQNYQMDNGNGKLNFRMSATDPERTFWQKLFSIFYMRFTDNSNVHTLELEQEYIAFTERQLAYTFDLNTLETTGTFQYDNKISAGTMTAHPHYDPVTKTKFNIALKSGLKSEYQIYALKGRKFTLLGKLPTWTPSYMHSFGMTEKYIIITQYPYQLTTWSTMQFLFTDTPYLENFAWRPQFGTTITVISKATGEVVKEVQAEAFFAFHHINAFERGNEVVVDVAAYADSTVVQGLYTQTMTSDVEYSSITAEYRRYVVNLDQTSTLASIGYDMQADDRLILPRINYNRYNTKEYQYAYGVNTKGDSRDFVNQLVRVNTHLGKVDLKYHHHNHYPSEPVFAPNPTGTDEDDGVIMSTVYDGTADQSYLLILNARDFSVVAKAVLPLRIPFGFHGRWYPNGNMYAV